MTVSRRGEFDPIGVGVQPSGVRLTNQRVILTLATVSPGSSAAELSRRSQLAPQTVAAVIEDLQHANLMRAGEVIRGRRGQPVMPHFLNREGAYAIGVEIGWRHVEAVLVNIAGEVIAQYRRDYAYPDARTIFNELATVVRQLSEKLPAAQRSRLFVVGIAAPYGIGRNIDLVSFSEDMRKLWRDTDIETEASRSSPTPLWCSMTAMPPAGRSLACSPGPGLPISPISSSAHSSVLGSSPRGPCGKVRPGIEPGLDADHRPRRKADLPAPGRLNLRARQPPREGRHQPAPDDANVLAVGPVGASRQRVDRRRWPSRSPRLC